VRDEVAGATSCQSRGVVFVVEEYGAQQSITTPRDWLSVSARELCFLGESEAWSTRKEDGL